MIIDIIMCAVLVLFLLYQYRRGVLLALRGFLTFLGAGYLSFRTQSVVSDFIFTSFVRPSLMDRVRKEILTGRATDPAYEWHTAMQKVLQVTTDPGKVSEYLVDKVIGPGVYAVVQAIVTAVLFVLFSVLLFLLLRMITNAVRTTGALRGADSVLGGLFGLLEGAVLDLTAAVLLNLSVVHGIIQSQWLAEQLAESRILTSVFQSLNPLLQSYGLAL